MCCHPMPKLFYVWIHFSPWGRSGLTTICNWFEFDAETELDEDKDGVNMDEDEDEDEDDVDDEEEDEDDDETSSLATELSLMVSKDDLLTKAAMLSPFAWSKSSPSSSSSSSCSIFWKENNKLEFSFVKKSL